MAHQIQTCDFTATTRHARRLTDAELAWTAKDCRETAIIHDQMDAAGIANNSGRYWDEHHTYTAEIQRRRLKHNRADKVLSIGQVAMRNGYPTT